MGTYCMGPFMMGRSVMFSIREGPFVNGYLLHGYAMGPSSLNKIEVIIIVVIIEGAETKKPKLEKIKKIDAIL